MLGRPEEEEWEEPEVVSDGLDDRAARGRPRGRHRVAGRTPTRQWRGTVSYKEYVRGRVTFALIGIWLFTQVAGLAVMLIVPPETLDRVQSVLLYVMGASLTLVMIAVNHIFPDRRGKSH